MRVRRLRLSLGLRYSKSLTRPTTRRVLGRPRKTKRLSRQGEQVKLMRCVNAEKYSEFVVERVRKRPLEANVGRLTLRNASRIGEDAWGRTS